MLVPQPQYRMLRRAEIGRCHPGGSYLVSPTLFDDTTRDVNQFDHGVTMQGAWLRSPHGVTSVVFVHGILSSGEACWRHGNGNYWPELLKGAADLEALGIYVFTYETAVFSGSYRISDVVDALKEHMRLDGLLQSERVIFVCHSMGGIVVRKFLVERTADLIERDTEIGIFLLASPSLGSSYANWLSPLAQFLGHAQADALRFHQNNAWLNDLDKEFQNLKEAGKLRIKGKELVEDKFVVLKKIWRQQVVQPFSGARYFGEQFKVPQSDHFSIAKPDGSGAIQHRLLCQFIRDMLDLSAGARIPEAETSAPVPREQVAAAVPEILIDWPSSELSHAQVAAFLAEARYRAGHSQSPWFKVSLSPLELARTSLSTLQEGGARSPEDRLKRIECLRRIEDLERIQNFLGRCFTLIISEDLSRRVGWGLMSDENMTIVVAELLRERFAEDERYIRVLLINHRARLQARLWVERHHLEKIFGCRLSMASKGWLSIIDCPLPKDLAEADWGTLWRALGAILRTTVERNIDPIDNGEAIHMTNWILSAD